MQTSSIRVHEQYALPVEGKVVRFKVHSITTVTKRTTAKASPSDTSSTIRGVIEAGDLPGTELERTRDVGPEALLGHYTEYSDLKKKQEEEERIATEKRNQLAAVRKRLQSKLYEISGIPRPEPTGEYRYREPFRDGSSGVEIMGDETVAKLLA